MTTYLPRILSFALFALLAAIIGFWASRFLAPKVAVAPVSVTAENTATSDATFARQFFGIPKDNNAVTAPIVDTQFQVLGLISGRAGVAVIAADGKPGKAISVGQTIVPGAVLKAIYPEKIVISKQGRLVELALPLKQNLAVLTSGNKSTSSGSTAILSGAVTSNNGGSNAPMNAAPSSVAPNNMSVSPVNQPMQSGQSGMPQNGSPGQNSQPIGQPPIPGNVAPQQQPQIPSGQDGQIQPGSGARGNPTS
jgi:general secretion pathway protein C